MKRLGLAIALLFALVGEANGQQPGAGQLQIGQGPGALPAWTSMSGACTLAASGAITCSGGGLPTPVRAGDIIFWNGSAWVTLAGNNAGTLFLSENASGVPVWAAAGGGSGTVTSVTIAAGTGIGLSGTCTITTSGTCTINATGGLPTPTRAGDIAYWNGTAWVTLAGNNSGTLFLQENASGVPSWQSAGTGGSVPGGGTTANFLRGPGAAPTWSSILAGPMVIGTDGTALPASGLEINLNASLSPLVPAGTEIIAGTDGSNASLALSAYSSSTPGAIPLITLARTGGTAAAPTAQPATTPGFPGSNYIAAIGAQAYNGTAYAGGPRIAFQALEPFTSSAAGSAIEFGTTAQGATARAQSMLLKSGAIVGPTTATDPGPGSLFLSGSTAAAPSLPNQSGTTNLTIIGRGSAETGGAAAPAIYSMGYGGFSQWDMFTAGGTSSAPTQTTAGSILGWVAAGGWNPSTPGWSTLAAWMKFTALDTFAAGAQGTAIEFAATAAGSGTRNPAMTVKSGVAITSTAGPPDPGPGALLLGNGGSQAGTLQVANATNANVTSLKAAAPAANINFVLPPTAGSSGQVLQTDGAGNTSWVGLTSAVDHPTVQFFGTPGAGTYTTPPGVSWIEVTMIAGGGGGQGGNGGTNGSDGQATCWNTTGPACTSPVISTSPGKAATSQTAGGNGGSLTGSGNCERYAVGGAGSVGTPTQGTTIAGAGGNGGTGTLAGGAAGQYGFTTTLVGAYNTGSGGAGGGVPSGTAGQFGGNGGGAGGYCLLLINAPAATYTFVVGAGGGGGTGAGGASNGAVGGAGVIQVTEHYGSGGGGAGSSVLANYISGCTLSNDGTTPATVLDIAPCFAADNSGTVNIVFTSGVYAKSIASGWTSGNGGGLGNGVTRAINTWYHVCAAYNGGTPDFFFDTSAACANKPTGIVTTQVRRIGSIKTDATGSGNIVAFVQQGDNFQWATPVQDYNASPTDALAHSLPLTVPSGVNVFATGIAELLSTSPSSNFTWGILLSDLALADVTPSSGLGTVMLSGQGTNNSVATALFQVRTNTAQSIRWRLNSSSTSLLFVINTTGWIDSRGKQ